ncbi:MAG TPA: hypothetical protein VIP77_09675 [Jiangellaceae bacterium]
MSSDAKTVLAVAILLVLLVGGYALMWLGWRRRRLRQSDLAALPADLPEAPKILEGIDGVYIGTTIAGDWLDRVVPHTLGLRSPALVTVSAAGVTVDRSPEPTVSIATTALHAVRVDRAGAGRAVRHDEYLILTWRHGGHLLDTAIRPRHHADLIRLHDAVEPLVPARVVGEHRHDDTQGATS